MTGGGSGFSVPYFGRKSKGVSCELLSVVTTLTNVDASALAKVKVGDVLSVRINATVDGLSAYDGNEFVGDIVIPEKDDFIRCIKLQTIYVADVLSINKGVCKVKVRAL